MSVDPKLEAKSIRMINMPLPSRLIENSYMEEMGEAVGSFLSLTAGIKQDIEVS